MNSLMLLLLGIMVLSANIKIPFKVLLMSAGLFMAVPLQSQHLIQKGSMSLEISVTSRGEAIQIAAACDGFDPETNSPINLIVPEDGAIYISKGPALQNVNFGLKIRTPRFIDRPGQTMEDFESSPGTQTTHTYIDHEAGDTLRLTWRLAYEPIQLKALTPGEDFAGYLSANFQLNPPSEMPSYDWETEEFIEVVDETGLPIEPEIPYSRNSLFFQTDGVTEDALIQLKGFHKAPQTYNPEHPFGLFLYEHLPEGSYEFIVQPYPLAPKNEWINYRFTILKPWWKKAPTLVGITFLWSLLIGGIFFGIYRRRQGKQQEVLRWKQQVTAAELKAIRAQLNPHFLFNALSSIQNLVVQQVNQTANTYLNKLSRLLRKVLTASEQPFHELDQELNLIRLYLDLEQLRHPFDYRISIGTDVAKETLVPTMLLQPFVENAVKHGVIGRKDGEILLEISKEKHQLLIAIKDNGPGFSSNNIDSSGLSLSKDRIRSLKEGLGQKVSIQVSNRQDQSGACIQIHLPID
ncbi:MAG: histidine kinase [Bacteroidota bacterium]